MTEFSRGARPLTTDMTVRPQWAMIGVPSGIADRPCRLIASAEWTEGQLHVWWNYETIWNGGIPVDQRLLSRRAEVMLAADPTSLIFIDAPTWQQCIEELFRQWSPEHGRTREVEGRKAIGDG